MKSKNKKVKRIVLIASLIVVIIGLIIAYVFLILDNKKDSSSTKRVTTKVKQSKYVIYDNSLGDFDLYFMQLENGKTNKIYSPLSIKYALAMLNEGTRGESRAQIASVIGDYEAKKYNNSSNMSLANAMFIKDTFKNTVKKEYINTLSKNYNADVIYDDFKNPDKVNEWVKEKTLKLIDKLVDDISDEEFLLVNALAIDMDWNEKFLEKMGYTVVYAHENFAWYGPSKVLGNSFAAIDSLVAGMEIDASINNYDIVAKLGESSIRETVGNAYREYLKDPDVIEYELNGDNSDAHINQVVNDYLESYIKELNTNYKKVDKNTEFMLYIDDSVKAFAKDLKEYDGTTLQYVGIMPISEDLDSYINNMTAKSINKIIGSLKELKLENFNDGVVTKIKGFIPKFKFEYKLDLLSDLKKLGITDVFDKTKADLTNMSSSKEVYIDKAIHKANIEFTQDGIKASAATMFGGSGAGGGFDYLYDVPVEEIDLTFDRPYMFIIRDKQSGEVWFAGTVYEPSSWSEDADYLENSNLYQKSETYKRK